jgi:antitoxin HigA-1
MSPVWTRREAVRRTAIHPGEVLADELAEIAVLPTELARQLAVPASRISQILKG